MSRLEEDKITNLLLPEQKGVCVDIGAGDGITWSNTFQFFQRGWGGLAIEADPTTVVRLQGNYKKFPKCQVIHEKVKPETIGKILKPIPSVFEFLSLDIDGYDLHVLRELLKAHRPKVVCMEYNAAFPPSIKFSVKYDPNYWWGVNPFFGCSIGAAVETMVPHGYGVVAVVADNVIFATGADNENWEDKWQVGFLERESEKHKAHHVYCRKMFAMSDENAFQEAIKRYPNYTGKFEIWR